MLSPITPSVATAITTRWRSTAPTSRRSAAPRRRGEREKRRSSPCRLCSHERGPARTDRSTIPGCVPQSSEPRIAIVASSGARLNGLCLCGAVRFLVTAPFTDAGRCHCKRCQIRSGQSSSLIARVPRAGLEITGGADELRVWRPPTGHPKWFCGLCGTHLFAGELDAEGPLFLRLGTLDPTPNVEPRWHAWVSSMPSWATLPDDGLPRYDRGLTAPAAHR